MMRKEGMVYVIVFHDNKNIWFDEKSLSQLIESYHNFIDFMAPILNFLFLKNPLRMTALNRPRYMYYYGAISIHNEKKFLSAKTRLLT